MVEVPLPQRASKRSVSDENVYEGVELLTKMSGPWPGSFPESLLEVDRVCYFASGAHGLNSVNEVT